MGNPPVADDALAQAMQRNKELAPSCPYMGPRNRIEAWKNLGADNVLLQGIQQGVRSPLHRKPEPNNPRQVPSAGIEDVTTTISEYLATKAVRRLTEEETARTRYWVPVFPRPKKDSPKVRVITDLRGLNACQQVPRHRAETWKTVTATIQDPTLQWGFTLDLKSYYHHLEVHASMQRWMRFRLGNEHFQIVAMPFGWSMSPWWANKLAKPVKAWLNDNKIPHCWWVDDVLLLGKTREECERVATRLVSTLTDLGIQINLEKSMKGAAQKVEYVGHHIDLRAGVLRPLQKKNEASRHMVKKQLKGNRMQPKNLAGLAGNLVDAAKSNQALQGLPQQVMRQAALGVSQNAREHPNASREKCWGTTIAKGKDLQDLLQQCLHAIEVPIPRVFRATNREQFVLRTDASDKGWGAQLVKCLGGRQELELKTCAQPWTRREGQMHISHREALASAKAVKTLLPFLPPGSKVNLETDATATAWLWRKGSKNKAMNTFVRQVAMSLAQKGIHIEAKHIAGQDNKRADWLSRNTDPKNFRLRREVFLDVCRQFNFRPTVDLFASRQNRQVEQFCSWRTDSRSLGNAFDIPWRPHRCWLNPPWELIPQALKKLKDERAEALVCLPVWRSAPWWATFRNMMTAHPIVYNGQPLYTNPEGQSMPPPRWGTLFTTVRG